jgi:hypothetical protein
MFLPDDMATCALIVILWNYHCGMYGYPQKSKNTSKPEWEVNPVMVRIAKGFEKK